MISLQEMFIENGWDTSLISYAGAAISLGVMIAIYLYVNRDDFLD
ncbi:hypothetical protein [Neptuniibacter sp.]|nr:hypothetical protein [Neptuniibacter sp.]